MTTLGLIAGITACIITACAFHITYQSYEHRTILNLIHAIEREQNLAATRAFVAHYIRSTGTTKADIVYTNNGWIFQAEIVPQDAGGVAVTNKIIATQTCIASEAYILSL